MHNRNSLSSDNNNYITQSHNNIINSTYGDENLLSKKKKILYKI